MISSLSSIKKNKQLKRWSTIFTEKVDEIKERKTKHDEAVDTMEIMTSKVAIVDMMDFSITTSYRNTLERHGKQHIDNMPPPPRQKPWDPALGMQLLCDLCNIPALNNSIICKKCNIVCHTHCIQKIKSTGRKLFQGHHSLEEWSCPHCEESLVADLTYYNAMVTKLREEKMHNLCANMIIKRMMIFLERKKLARKMKAVVKLQAVFRRKAAHMKFSQWKKNIMRLIILEITALPSKLLNECYSPSGASPMVVVTVHDTFKNIQLFRFDRTIPETFSDAFFIPGITAHMSVFITIAMKEEIYNYSMVGQCQLALRDIQQIDVTKPFVLKFSDRISWPPQDIKNAVFTYHLNPLPPNSPYKDYFSKNTPNNSHSNSIGIGLHTSNNSTAAVSFAPSTALSNSLPSAGLSGLLPPGLNNAPNTFITSGNISSGMSVASGSVVTSATTATGAASSAGASNGPPSPTPVNPYAPVGQSLPPTAFAPPNTCLVNYIPQNNTSSMCRMIQGPPLDILRRPADLSKKPGQASQKSKSAQLPGGSNNQPNNYRNSRYWICLYKLKLMFFQYYGDIVPRFIADISDVVAKVERDKGRTTTLVNLIHPDGRVWLLEFQAKQDACKFEFAVNESRKAKNEAKGSKFLVTSEFYTPEMSFGFHIVRERE